MHPQETSSNSILNDKAVIKSAAPLLLKGKLYGFFDLLCVCQMTTLSPIWGPFSDMGSFSNLAARSATRGVILQPDGSFSDKRGHSPTWRVVLRQDGSFSNKRGHSPTWRVVLQQEGSFSNLTGRSPTRGVILQPGGSFSNTRGHSPTWRVVLQHEGSFSNLTGRSPTSGSLSNAAEHTHGHALPTMSARQKQYNLTD